MDSFIFNYILFLSSFFKVDPVLVFAIGFIESNFNKHKRTRFEPSFYKKYIIGKKKYLKMAPIIVASSYGYLHIMYTTAEMMGFDLDPSFLHEDKINLYYATKYICRCSRIYKGKEIDIVSAYNAGRAAKRKKGNKIYYRNQRYINKVFKVMEDIKINGISVDGKKIFITMDLPF